VLFLSAFAAASLAGWHEADPTWIRPTLEGEGVLNPCGPLGANVADLLYRSVGVGSWIVLLGLVVPVVNLAGRAFASWPRWVVGSGLYVVALTILDLASGPVALGQTRAGGRLGHFIGDALVSVVGSIGAWMALAAAFVSAASLLLGVSWAEVAERVMARVESLWPAVRDRAATAGSALGGWGRSSVVSFALLVWSLVLTSAQRIALFGQRTLRTAVGGLLGTRRLAKASLSRMWQSMTRGRAGGDLEATEWEDVTGLSLPEAAGNDLRSLMGLGVDATQVSLSPPWAEVAWDGATGGVRDVLGMFPLLERRAQPSVSRAAAASVRPEPAQPDVGPVVDVVRATPVRVDVEETSDEVFVAPEIVLDQERISTARDDAARQAEVQAHASVSLPSDRELTAVTDSLSGHETSFERDQPTTDAPPVQKAEGLEEMRKDDGGAVSDRSSLYFQLPGLSLLDEIPAQRAHIDEEELVRLAATVESSLASFKVTGKVSSVRVGPVVTTFEFSPDAGISVRRIAGLQDDLAMALCALSVRVVAPIPGKGVVGIEIPSRHRMTIYLREVLASEAFRKHSGALPVVLGKDVENEPVVADLAKMPHLLVGGTTGSGKSVGVNGMLMSLLYTKTPDELRLLLIDPKKLEFEAYSDTPHLLHPVVTDAPKAAAALAWACREMDRRYELLARWKTRSISNYNRKVERESRNWTREKAVRFAPKGWSEGESLPQPETLPYIVIVIDELADLMMVAKKDVQVSIVRLAQMARACGMHLIIATQRPSVDVVTGLIKSNLPTRIAFKLRSVVDSRTILDQGGAEKLLGMGDMLHLPGAGEVRRCHGPFVSDDEVGRVISFLSAQRKAEFIEDITAGSEADAADGDVDSDLDVLYDDAVNLVIEKGKASTSMVQRHLKIGYNRAARIVDSLERMGVVGPADGARPRQVLVGRNLG
jgi:S-DNA-T family DNA segregation ATPase FtsK/SpoIIIE